jgi:hypothetical protein
MKVNVNKEQLLKHHFWILSGCYLLVVLIPLVLLGTGVSDSITKEQQTLESAKKDIKGVTNPKNQKWVDAFEKQDKFVEDKKNIIWAKAWELQKDMMTWPPDLQETFSQRYRYMGDPISDTDSYVYSQKYSTQFQELFDLVDPVRSRDEGAVQFRTGNSLKDMVELLGIDHKFTLPTKDDIWLAQEDLWVKRELLRIVRDANDAVATFKEVKPGAAGDKSAAGADAAEGKEKKEVKAAEPPPASDPNHKIFRNPYWELDLSLIRSNKGKSPFQLSGKITNISDHKLACGNIYKVKMDRNPDSAFALLPIDREPLAAGESDTFGFDVPPTVQVRGLYGVEQVWTWRTAPVKRIDEVRLGYNSSRTASIYTPAKWVKPRWVQADKPEGDSAPAPEAPDMGARGKFGGMTMPGMGGMGSAAQGEQTKHGLNLIRYSDANEQVRHMPVAMVVVMDESHIPDLLAAVDNSNLRIQLLQFHWHHLRGEKIQPPAQESSEASPQPTNTPRLPGMPGGFVPGASPGSTQQMMQRQGGMMNKQMGAMMKGMMGGTGMRQGGGAGGMGMGLFGQRPLASGPSGTPGTEEEEEAEMDLVEVAVYGLASLYERYPPKSATAPGGSQQK